jgi:hypothetical protein
VIFFVLIFCCLICCYCVVVLGGLGCYFSLHLPHFFVGLVLMGVFVCEFFLVWVVFGWCVYVCGVFDVMISKSFCWLDVVLIGYGLCCFCC